MLFLKTNDQITLVFSTGPEQVNANNKCYDAIVQALKDEKSEQEVKTILHGLPVQPEVQKLSNTCNFTYEFGSVKYKGEVVSNKTTERITEYAQSGLPYKHLLLFLQNVDENPSFRGRQHLFIFAENNYMPIDEKGRLLGYKAVTHGYKDKHTGTIDNSIGQTVKMDRRDVDDDPNRNCSNGLHVGSWSYAKTFMTGNDKMIIVAINPKDVVSVPHGKGDKVRCCEYEVLADYTDKLNQSPVYASENLEPIEVDGDGYEDLEDDYYYDEDEDWEENDG